MTGAFLLSLRRWASGGYRLRLNCVNWMFVAIGFGDGRRPPLQGELCFRQSFLKTL
jgi:hypothetical protein